MYILYVCAHSYNNCTNILTCTQTHMYMYAYIHVYRREQPLLLLAGGDQHLQEKKGEEVTGLDGEISCVCMKGGGGEFVYCL